MTKETEVVSNDMDLNWYTAGPESSSSTAYRPCIHQTMHSSNASEHIFILNLLTILKCFFDISAAFETVDHDILLQHIKIYFGYSGTLLDSNQ